MMLESTINEQKTEILPLIKKRWIPREFDPVKNICQEDLNLLFEAARWAPSSYNEQPWSFIVATKENSDEFKKIISILMTGNKAWASQASALVLTVASLRSSHSGSENFHALYDLGASVANLTTEATELNICVHQMGGFHHDSAKVVFKLPEMYSPVSVLAIGYLPENADFEARARELFTKRKRKPLDEFVFRNAWGNPFFEMNDFQKN